MIIPIRASERAWTRFRKLSSICNFMGVYWRQGWYSRSPDRKHTPVCVDVSSYWHIDTFWVTDGKVNIIFPRDVSGGVIKMTRVPADHILNGDGEPFRWVKAINR